MNPFDFLGDRHPPYWSCGGWSTAIALFTTRRGGTSLAPYDSLNLGRSTPDDPRHVDENRSRVLGAMGLSSGQLATAGQIHGTKVRIVRSPGLYPECDALVTRQPGLALAVSGADCLPLLYIAPSAVAAAHSGWRGTADGMPATALTALCESAATDPGGVVVYLGPCIRACCYVVGPEVAARFPAAVVSTVDGRLHLDIAAAATRQLAELGVPPDRIHDIGACTTCGTEGYFSHRRDRGVTGRQWGAIALRPLDVS